MPFFIVKYRCHRFFVIHKQVPKIDGKLLLLCITLLDIVQLENEAVNLRLSLQAPRIRRQRERRDKEEDPRPLESKQLPEAGGGGWGARKERRRTADGSSSSCVLSSAGPGVRKTDGWFHKGSRSLWVFSLLWLVIKVFPVFLGGQTGVSSLYGGHRSFQSLWGGQVTGFSSFYGLSQSSQSLWVVIQEFPVFMGSHMGVPSLQREESSRSSQSLWRDHTGVPSLYMQP